jgi:hypothetical protein
MAGYVYLIWAEGTSHYKIGRTNNPAKRLKALQTGVSGNLQLIACVEYPNPASTETLLHRKFNGFRHGGEWFNFHPFVMPEVLGCFGVMTEWDKQRLESITEKVIDSFSQGVMSGIEG